MIITIISALLVSAAVLVGIPLYKSWATIGNCLVHPGWDFITDDDHEFYPCGFVFTVWHLGYDPSNPSADCNCDHYGEFSISFILRDYVTKEECPEYDVLSGITGSSVECQQNNKTQYCVSAHVPYSGSGYEYKFICSEGEEETDWIEWDHPNQEGCSGDIKCDAYGNCRN